MKKLNIKAIDNAPKLIMIIGGISLALALLALGYLAYYKSLVENPRVVAKVGNVEITREDLNNEIYRTYLVGTPEKPKEVSLQEKVSLTNFLVEVEISRQYDEKNGITVSDEEIQESIEASQVADRFEKYTDVQKSAIKTAHKNSLYIAKAKEHMLGYREGEFILFRFDKYVEYTDIEKIEGVGDDSLIATQRAYAQKLANEVSQKLSSGQITFEEAKTLVGLDTTIGVPGFAPYRPGISGYFGKEHFGDGLGYFDENSYKGFKEGVLSKDKDQITEPFVIQGNTGTGFTDIAYVLVKNTNVASGNVTSYNEWLSEQKTVLPAKIFIGRNFWEDKKVSVSNILNIQTANACTAAYAGTHKTNITLYMNQITAAGALSNYDPGNVSFTAGDNDMLVYNSTCTTPTYAYSVIKNADGDAIIGLNDSSDGTSALIDCGRTSVASINLPDATSTGYWEVDLSSDYRAAWYKSFNSTTGVMALDLSTSTTWANGDNIYKRVVYHQPYTPEPTVSYNFRPFINYSVNSVDTDEANPGDTVMVKMFVQSDDSDPTIMDAYIRNNLYNNGLDSNTEHTGTSGSPYSIRELVGASTTAINDMNLICATDSGCIPDVQGSGLYSVLSPTSTDINQRQWRMGSIDTDGIVPGDYYQAEFLFKVPNDANLRGKFIGTKMRAAACSSNDKNASKCTSTILSNLATLKIRDDVSLQLQAVTGGTVSGAAHKINTVFGPDQIVNSTFGTESFSLGEVTRALATASANYTFTGWTAVAGLTCPLSSGTSGVYSDITMNGNVGCQANFVSSVTPPPPATPTLSCSVSPQTGLSPLVVRADATVTNPVLGTTYQFSYNMGDGTTLDNKQSPVYYTYSTAGSYSISVSSAQVNGGATVMCNPSSVTVSDPTSGGGGEVTP